MRIIENFFRRKNVGKKEARNSTIESRWQFAKNATVPNEHQLVYLFDFLDFDWIWLVSGTFVIENECNLLIPV